MRRLLIVAPHMPPTDTVDMHRVRMNAGHYIDHGWQPDVVCVDSADTGRSADARLVRSMCDRITIVQVSVPRRPHWRSFGISAIGLRAYRNLAEAGDRLIEVAATSGQPFDLAFFSTTAFPVMALGPRWLRRFGLPYVLDMQDPWFTAPPESRPFRRTGLKHQVMRAIHGRLEAVTAPKAAGLIAVSPRYIEALRAAYPPLRDRPAETIPFGWSEADFALAREVGRPWSRLEAARRSGKIVALSAGRGGQIFETALRTLFRLASLAPRDGLLRRIRFMFLGTGYLAAGNPEEVMPLAGREGIAEHVEEAPDRLPLLDALATLEAADLLVILGSDDRAYQPSKLHQYLALEKPVLVVAPAGSRLADQVAGLPGVVFVEANSKVPETVDVARVEAALAAALDLEPADFAPRRAAGAAFEAAVMAARECALFDAALAARQAPRWGTAPSVTHVHA
jgi:hypothetical protein